MADEMDRRHLTIPFLALFVVACPGSKDPSLDWHVAADDTGGGAKLDVGPRPDLTITYPEGGSCGPQSCTGCCLPGGTCVTGNADTQCGRNGAWCLDCFKSKSACKLGKCVACAPKCKGVACGSKDGCGGTCGPGSGCCTPKCKGKTCGDSDGCGGTCKSGSGCCEPKCAGKKCGAPDACGGTCKPGSGCCNPTCNGIPCGSPDGCGGTCQPGSGCCTPSCAGKKCGQSNGCGGTCQPGSGCCNPSCSGKKCGESDNCGGSCYGPCDGFAKCDSSTKTCKCGKSPHYKWSGGLCKASCGTWLKYKGWSNIGAGCCKNGCKGQGSSYNETHDCTWCCQNTSGSGGCK